MTTRTYVTLEQDEMDDMLVGTLLAQERDHYLHTINIERYKSLLTLELTFPSSSFRNQIEKSLNDSLVALAQVEAIIAALEPQLPPMDRLLAARNRLLNKSGN